MAQPNNGHPSYLFMNRNPQNSNSPMTRGQEYGTTLSPRLTQHPSIPFSNVHQMSNSPHLVFHPIPGHQLSSEVRAAYSFGHQPQDDPRYVPGNASNDVSYGYRPGHDPPVVGERGALYQPSWSPTGSHLNAYPDQDMPRRGWPDAAQPSNPGASHQQTAYRHWNGEAQPSFSPPTSPQAVYQAHHGRESMSPVESRWSPQNVGYYPLPRPGPPPLNNNHQHHQDHTQYSPQSTPGNTPPANPFGHFEQDVVRDMAYHEQRSSVDDARNSEMLGLGMPRIDCSCGPIHVSSASPGFHAPPPAIGSDYTAHNSSDHNQPSTSAQAQVLEAQIDGSGRAVQLSHDVEAHFPDSPDLKDLATDILNQRWCELNEEEPPITHNEPVIMHKIFKRAPKSRFEPFFDDRLRCLVMETNGDRCSHVTTRKDRAVGHARAHFDYKPFACSGNCGKVGCRERYTCSSFRNDHVGRKKNPKRPCNICQKHLTAQNLKRHMKQHIAESSQPTAQEGEREEPAPKRRKLAIFRRPFSKK